MLGLGLGLTSLGLHGVFQSKTGMISSIAGYGSGSYKSSGSAQGVLEQDGCDFLQYWVWVLMSGSAWGVSEQDRCDFLQW